MHYAEGCRNKYIFINLAAL